MVPFRVPGGQYARTETPNGDYLMPFSLMPLEGVNVALW